VVYIYHLASSINRALTWPEIYGAAAVGAFIVFIGVAMFVALFAHDDKRANRAYKILGDLLKVFQRRTR
jgi:hypothetical protein